MSKIINKLMIIIKNDMVEYLQPLKFYMVFGEKIYNTKERINFICWLLEFAKEGLNI